MDTYCSVNPVEELAELIDHVHITCCWLAVLFSCVVGDGPHSPPHLSGVVILQLSSHFPLVLALPALNSLMFLVIQGSLLGKQHTAVTVSQQKLM